MSNLLNLTMDKIEKLKEQNQLLIQSNAELLDALRAVRKDTSDFDTYNYVDYVIAKATKESK